MYPMKGPWWFPAFPFFFFIFAYGELKKFLSRRLPGTWYEKELNW
jgi:hypothetical protein